MQDPIITDTLQYVSKYDFVERNQGVFKFQQEALHKSNIFSIQLNNTGLNPDTEETLNYIWTF